MARFDGIDRTSARNVNLTAVKIGNAQRHNEREKESYTNPDIIPERTPQNIHFKKPTAGYAEMFAQMEITAVIPQHISGNYLLYYLASKSPYIKDNG